MTHAGFGLKSVILLKIPMSNPQSGLRVRTLTVYSDDIYPRACLAETPLPLSDKARSQQVI